MTSSTLTPETARQQLEEHRHWRYRGCAPDPDQPMCAQGNPAVPLDAWGPYTEEGGEAPSARNARLEAAEAVCAACPVLAACRTYGLTETPDGRLAEPEGVLGGMRSLDRHKALIARRQEAGATAAPSAGDARLDEARTAQKQALLKSLARETDEELVAYRAGMDVRTSNWHRAILTGLLGLDKETASRQQLLERARELGVLPAVRIVPDGRWPIAAAPNTDGSRQRRIAPARPVQLLLPGFPHLTRAPRPQTATGASPARRPRPRLQLVRTQPLTLPLPATTVLETAA
ncbi:WhiB family transcriptional regulator [Streptomyces angustmyceticus]|uniref:WhiB family transcriptional regulator n=1 Tax=Streptomyces angustmyceticus TaxID=285578 RepID=UPI0036A87C45